MTDVRDNDQQTQDQTQGQVDGQDQQQDEFDPERAMQTIKKLRQVEKDLKAQLKAAQADANPALKAENEELRGQLQQMHIAFDAMARGLGKAAEDVHLFIDKELWATDSDAAFDRLRQEKPYLFRAAVGTDTGSAASPRRGRNTPLTREKIAAMSYEEQNSRWDEIKGFFAGNR